jgi:hypothetical protein
MLNSKIYLSICHLELDQQIVGKFEQRMSLQTHTNIQLYVLTKSTDKLKTI